MGALECLTLTTCSALSWLISSQTQIRNGALECLQRSVVAAEKFAVPAVVVQRVLLQLLVPMTQDLVRKVAVTSPAVLHREFPQVRVCLSCVYLCVCVVLKVCSV